MDREGPEIRAGRLHELVIRENGDPAARVFAAWCANIRAKQVLWIIASRAGELCPHALSGLLEPQRIVLVRAQNPADGLWSAEEGLRSGAIGSVMLETDRALDLRESRRLQLAAEAGGALGLFLGPSSGNTAAETRWRCEALPGRSGEAAIRFAWKQVKNKRGPISDWEAIRDETTGRMRVAPLSGGGADAEECARPGPPLRGDGGGARRLAALLAGQGGAGGGIVAGHGAG